MIDTAFPRAGDGVPMDDFSYSSQMGRASGPARRGAHPLLWILAAMALVAFLGCGGIMALLGYVAAYGPETSVYTGNRIPARYLETIKSVGALDNDETIFYFYSDALTDIRDGFYFVSDKKVVIYIEEAGQSPLTAVPFDQIRDTEIYRNEDFFEDSQITLYLEDGQILSFPVSSEFDRDQQFYDAIRDGMGEPDLFSF